MQLCVLHFTAVHTFDKQCHVLKHVSEVSLFLKLVILKLSTNDSSVPNSIDESRQVSFSSNGTEFPRAIEKALQ